MISFRKLFFFIFLLCFLSTLLPGVLWDLHRVACSSSPLLLLLVEILFYWVSHFYLIQFGLISNSHTFCHLYHVGQMLLQFHLVHIQWNILGGGNVLLTLVSKVVKLALMISCCGGLLGRCCPFQWRAPICGSPFSVGPIVANGWWLLGEVWYISGIERGLFIGQSLFSIMLPISTCHL